MAKKIIIAELDLSIDSLIKNTTEVKKSIDELKAKQNEIAKSSEPASAAFVQNAADLKVLTTAYNSNIKVLAEQTQATADQTNRQGLLQVALQAESKTINEAREQNKLLTKLRNETNTATAEGQVELEKLNKKLDQNNAYIKDNVDATTKQKMEIGNYGMALNGLDGILSKFGINGNDARNIVQGFTSTVSKGSNDIVDFANNTATAGAKLIGFKTSSMLAAETQAANATATGTATAATNTFAASQGAATAATAGTTIGLRAFTVALAATGIGAIVIIIGVLIASLSKLDGPMDAIEKAAAGFGGAFGKVVDTISNFILGITSLKDGLSKVAGFFADPIGSIKAFAKEVGKAYDQAARLKGLEQDLGDVKEIYEIRNKQLQSEIDLNNVKLKSKTLTAAQELEIERKNAEAFKEISANKTEVSKKSLDIAFTNAVQTSEKLTNIEKQRLAQDLANGSIRVAQELKNNNVIEDAAYQKLLASVGNKAETNQALAEQEERNQNKQEKARAAVEARAEKAAKAHEDALKAIQDKKDRYVELKEQESEFYKETNRFRDDDLAKAKDFAEKDKEVLKARLAANQLTKLEFDTASLAIDNDLKEKKKTIDEEALTQIKDFEQRKKDLKNEIELQKITDEEERATVQLTQNLEAELLEIDNLKLSIEQKNELKKQLAEKYILDAQEIAERGAAKMAKIQAEATVNEINYNKAKNEALLSLAGQLSKTILGLFGDSIGAQIAGIAVDAVLQVAKVGIATSSAAAINTANGIALGIPTVGGSVKAATVANAVLFANAAVQKSLIIGSAALAAGAKFTAPTSKFAGGGFLEAKGKSHEQGGMRVDIDGHNFGTMQGGEGLAIMNKGAFEQFKAFNYTYGDSDVRKNNGVGFMAGGGIITTAVGSKQQDFSEIVNELRNMPTPIVDVKDIIQQVNSRVDVTSGADF